MGSLFNPKIVELGTLVQRLLDVGDRLVTAQLIFDDVPSLLADETLTYASGSGNTVAAGRNISAGLDLYDVALSSAVDHDVMTAGGVKLYLIGGQIPSITLEALGATVDGVTDNSPQLSKATVTGGAIDLSADTYYFSTLKRMTDDGTLVRGAGRFDTKIIFDCSGDPGLIFDGVKGCSFEDLTIQSNDITAPIVQMGDGASVTWRNSFNRVDFTGNSGGARPPITALNHCAVKGVEGGTAVANYFHRFNDCSFNSVFAPFDADYNANAWQITGGMAQNVWRVFRGGFSQWVVDGLHWHSSAGADGNYAIFAELYGKEDGIDAQRNQFLGIQAEPGVALTKMWDMNVNTSNNYFSGTRQTTTLGDDLGEFNGYELLGGDRAFSFAALWTMFVDGLNIRRIGGSGSLNIWGNGINSDTGAQRWLKLFSGASPETRHLLLQQTVNGDAEISSNVIGKMRVKGASGVVLEGNNVANLTVKDMPTQTTVGAAGGAAAVPATPTKYLLIEEEGGSSFAIPMYAS